MMVFVSLTEIYLCIGRGQEKNLMCAWFAFKAEQQKEEGLKYL